jgi:hypothetical protein
MTGRGIDQILSHPCAPLLHENYVKSARDYIRLAEQVNGRGPRAVKFSYIWGAALQELTAFGQMHASSISKPASPAGAHLYRKASTTE